MCAGGSHQHGCIAEHSLDKPFMDSGYTYLVPPDGQVVLRSNGSPNLENLCGQFRSSDSDRDRMQLNMDTEGNGSLECEFNGQKLFMSYVSLGVNDWYVISILSEQTVQAKERKVRYAYCILNFKRFQTVNDHSDTQRAISCYATRHGH